MIFKILIAGVLVWGLWRLWHGSGPLPGTPKPPPPRPMADAEREARAVLGVGADAGNREISAAHRRLMRVAHPDHGGSSELARRINAARDTLLK